MIITIGLKKKVHEMEREHCQIEHRKSKSCPTARQIKFDSVRHLPTSELSGYGCTRASKIFMESPIIGTGMENQEPKILIATSNNQHKVSFCNFMGFLMGLSWFFFMKNILQ